MRCVIVNGSRLKADTVCVHCGNHIGETYIREIGSGLIYCGYHCYSVAVEAAAFALVCRATFPNLGAGRS